MSNALTALTDADKTRFIPVVDEILKSSDLYTITIKRVRNGLSERTGIDFTAVKKAIDKVITDRFDILLAEHNDVNEAEAKDEEPEEEPEEEDVKPAKEEASSPEPEFSQAGSASPFQGKKRKSSSSVEEDARLAAELHAQLNGGRPHRGSQKTKPVKKPGKKRSKKKSKDTVSSDISGDEAAPIKKKRKANPNNAFMKPLILSQPLATFIGESQMARPEVVKRIWAYVKANNLQDPTDRRYILCDEIMKPVFGDKVHMFTMNKVLASNMYKADEVAQPGGGGTNTDEVASDA